MNHLHKHEATKADLSHCKKALTVTEIPTTASSVKVWTKSDFSSDSVRGKQPIKINSEPVMVSQIQKELGKPVPILSTP